MNKIDWKLEFCDGCDNREECTNPCPTVKGAIMRLGKRLKGESNE